MTKAAFHDFMVDPHTAAKLDTLLREFQEIDARLGKRTVYAIQRHSDGYWWVFGDVWVSNGDAARRFEFMTDAELIGMAECVEDMHRWAVVPVLAL